MNPSNARKHSDSRLETRLSRSKNINSSSNATDSLLGGHSCSTSTTRKRKIDSCESVTAAAVSNLDADSSGGDGSGSTTSIHQSSQAKFSKHDEITSQQLMLVAGSPSSSSSSSQDDVIFMNLMMANDEDTTPGTSVATHQLHNRFCEGLGDQRMRCPGVHRFEVFVSDTTLLGQDSRSQQNNSGQNRHSVPISSDLMKPLLGSGGQFQNGRSQSTFYNKQNIGNYDSLNSIFGSSGLGGGGIWPVVTNGGSLLATGSALWKNQKPSTKRFVFECELGDKWVETPLRKSCKLFRTVNKPAISVNQVMNRLELQGVKLLSVLSSGKFSHVFVGHMFSHKNKIAIKIYEKKTRGQIQKPTNPSQNKQNLKTFPSIHPFSKTDVTPDEISIHKNLLHRNVVQLFYSEQIDQHYVSFMELCDHGNLSQLLKINPGSVLAEPICRRYFRDMLESLFYLHSQNIVHRDIRCENFLVDYHDTVKLCDFTHATRFSNGDELQTLSYGYPAYLSPEILEEKPFNPRTADVWALGVCLHVLCTSKLPFLVIPLDLHSSGRNSDVQAAKSTHVSPNNLPIQFTNQTHSTMDLQNAEDNFTGKLSNLLNVESSINNNPSAGSSSKPFDLDPLIRDISPINGLKGQQFNEVIETDPLTLMKKGLDLRIIAPSVNLSHEVSELLKGLLHYVLKVRYSLNRARSSAWMKQNGIKEDDGLDNEKPYIGNHYMLSTNQKFNSSDKEKALKEAFEI